MNIVLQPRSGVLEVLREIREYRFGLKFCVATQTYVESQEYVEYHRSRETNQLTSIAEFP